MAIPDRPLFALLDDAVARFPDHPFIDFLGKRYSYRVAGQIVEKLSAGFRRLGVGPGIKVGLFLPNCPYFVFCYFAVLKAGGTVVTYNPLLAEQEVERQVQDSGTEIMVTLDLARLYTKIAKLPSTSGLRMIVVARMTAILPFPKNLLFALVKRGERARIPRDSRHIAYETLASTAPAAAPMKIEPHRDIAVLLYTGGTTGLPKGVCLTHANIYANTMQSERLLTTAQHGAERVLAVIPFFHAFGMTAVMNTSIAIGAEIILLPRFEVAELLATIDRRKPTLFAAVPTIYVAINNAPDLARHDFSSFKMCNSGGDALPPSVKVAFERHADCRLLEGYGLTEASPVVTFNPIEGVDKPGSIGLPLADTTVEIISIEDDRSPMPTGELGQICVSGPQVMAGYWNNAEATASTIVDGRLRTGDLGYRDKDGYVFLVDRLKDMIKTGGYNVYPSVVEAAIRQHPAVVDVGVVGVPDPYWGQRVVAFVVSAAGQRLTAESLSAFLQDKLSAMEQPKVFRFPAELPRSAIGKVLRTELIAQELRTAKAADASSA